MRNLFSRRRSPGLAALFLFVTVAISLCAVRETEGALESRNFEKRRNSDRNEMEGFDESEGDGYGYDDDDYDHSNAKRNDDKIDTEKINLKTETLKTSSKEGLGGDKMEKQESKNVEGSTGLVGGGNKQEAKLNDDKSNVAVEEGKPKPDLQSDEEKPNNKNDKVRINDGEAKKPAKTFKETQKLEEGKIKENVGVKSDKNSKAAEESKVSSVEKNSGVEKAGAEAKESSKEDKAGFDRKNTDTLNKKTELKAETSDAAEDRQREKEDFVTKLRQSDREKSDPENSGSVKLTGTRREESLREEEEEKPGLDGASLKKSESGDADPKTDEEGGETEVGEDPEKLQPSSRESYDSLASEDFSDEIEDLRDNNSEDSIQLNAPVVKLEDTDYHKNFVKSLNRFKKKGYAIREGPDMDRLVVRNFANEYEDFGPARKRARSRKIRRTKPGNPNLYDLREISRLRSKFLNVLKDGDSADAAGREPRYRKRKSPKTLEFKIQIIDQNEAKTKNSETRSLREKKRIRFGQGAGKLKNFHVGKKRLILDPEGKGEKGKRNEDIVYAPSKTSYEEVEDEPKALVLVKKKQNGEKLTKTFVDGSAVKCLEDDVSSDDLAKILAQKKEYVVLKKVPSKNEYKVYGESETEEKTQAKEVERNEEMARPERKQKIKYVSVDENDLGASEDADTSQIRTKGFKSIEKKPPKVHQEPSGLSDLFKEEEEKKNEAHASQDPRYPGNENDGEKEIIYVDEKANAAAAVKPKASKEENANKITAEEKDFRSAIMKQSESNREKAQRLQDKTQGKEVIIYNGAAGGYGAKRLYADYKVPERVVDLRYRGPQIGGKYPEKYLVFNDNLEPKHQIKIIKNDGIIPDDRIIETDRRIQSHKNHHQQGNRILDKNRFVEGEDGAVYAVVKPSGSKKNSLADLDPEEDYSSSKETSKRNSKAKDFFNGNEISGNFERFLKDFQELTENAGSDTHRERIRAADDAGVVSGDRIQEIKSYGDANLKNLNKILEDLLKSQSEGLNRDQTQELSKDQDKNLEEPSRIKEGQTFSKPEEKDSSETENRGSDPDETDEDEFNGNAEDFQMDERENEVGVRTSRQLDVAPAETEETVLENQIQQILKNLKNNKNGEGKSRKKRDGDEKEIANLFEGSRKLLSFEPESPSRNLDPAILELFGKSDDGKGEREKPIYDGFIRKREIDIDESVPNRLNDLLETSFAGAGNEKREVVKKDQPVWESNNNDDEGGGSDQIAEDGSYRDVGSDSVVEKRHASNPNSKEEDLSLESDKVNFYDSEMMPSNEWKRGNDRLFGGREKIARNIKLKRSEKESYEPPDRSQRESSVLKRDQTKKPVHEKNEQFMIDKATFEDMIKKYLESGQGSEEAKNQNEMSKNHEVTYQHITIPKPSFQTTIDFTKLDNDHKLDHKNPVKDPKMKILPSGNSPPGSKDKNVKITFLNPYYKSNLKGNDRPELSRKNDQGEEEKPSKESSLRDLAEIVRKLKNFFETKKIDLQGDSSGEAESETQTQTQTGNEAKNKFKEPYGELSEEGRMRADKYLEFENDPESEFDGGDSEEEEEEAEAEAEDRAEDAEDETVQTREPADSPSRLDENELSNKWSTFSNVYPKDDRKNLKSGNKNGLTGSESDKRAYFKDRRKQEILFDQDQYLGGDGSNIEFANENPKFFGKKLTSNLNRISSSEETEEKDKEKKINKWQGFRDEDQFIVGKEKRDFSSKNKALQGVHRYYPKNNLVNNYEIRKIGNTLDTGSMKRNAMESRFFPREENVLDEDLDDDVIQNIIGGYILRKSAKIRPEQALNSAGFADGKSKFSESEKMEQKVRSTNQEFSKEAKAFEKFRKTLKRLSSGHMTEAHYRKYHRKNSGNKRGAETFDEDSFEETSQYQRNGQTGNSRKSNPAEKSGNNIRITITSEEESGNGGLKENRRKRYEASPKGAAEEGFERVLADSKSVGRQAWSKSRSGVAAAAPDGPLIVDLNEKIPWAGEDAPETRKERKRNEPPAESYFFLNKKKRSVGSDTSSSLAVSNHVDKVPIANRALPVKQMSLPNEKTPSFFQNINGGSEHQRKSSLVNKNPFDSGKSEKAEEMTCPCPDPALPRSDEAQASSSEESTKKIGQQIMGCILSRVESNPRFKEALGPGLACQKQEKFGKKQEGTCPAYNKPISRKIRPLLKKLMTDVEKIVEEDEKRRACVKMDKETRQFLRSMVEKSEGPNLEPFHNQNKFNFDSLLPKTEGAASEDSRASPSSLPAAAAPPPSSSSSLQAPVRAIDEDASAKKRYLFLKLMEEYRQLSPQEKTKAEPLYAYLRSRLMEEGPISGAATNDGKSYRLPVSEPIKNAKSTSAEEKHFKGTHPQNGIRAQKTNLRSQTWRRPGGNANLHRQKASQKSNAASPGLSDPTAINYRIRSGERQNLALHSDRKSFSKPERKEKIRPEKELHKLGIGDAAALQLTLGQKPWTSNLDLAKGAKPRHLNIQ